MLLWRKKEKENAYIGELVRKKKKGTTTAIQKEDENNSSAQCSAHCSF